MCKKLLEDNKIEFEIIDYLKNPLTKNDIRKILKNLDNGLNTCSIFLDLTKAFDSVSHEILLKKLWKYGICKRNCIIFL